MGGIHRNHQALLPWPLGLYSAFHEETAPVVVPAAWICHPHRADGGNINTHAAAAFEQLRHLVISIKIPPWES